MTETYCRNCGEDEKRNLAYVGTYADSDAWRCKTCGEEFQTNSVED